MPGITTCKAIFYKVHVECWHKDSETTYKDILHCHIKSCIHTLVHYKYTKRSSCCCRHQPLTGGWWMLVVTNSLVTSSFMTWLFMIFFFHIFQLIRCRTVYLRWCALSQFLLDGTLWRPQRHNTDIWLYTFTSVYLFAVSVCNFNI